MDLRLMGNVEIHDGARSVLLLRAGERCVLASFALEPGRRIHVDTLIDRLWGDDPPTGASHTITSYIRTVRKTIEEAGGKREWLRNLRPATYQLNIDSGLVDYHRFTALIAQARTSNRGGKPADAVAGLYQRALALRTSEVLGGVPGQWAASRRYAIEQEHLDAVCELYEQQLSAGNNTAVATHATNLVMEVVPTDRMIALATHGLARSGQHAAIPGFLIRATRRMWDTAQARPSPHILAEARHLIANPTAPPSLPQADLDGVAPAGQPVPEDAMGDHLAGHPHADTGEPPPRESTRGAIVEMVAEHNQHVYQAAGDQYITGA